MRELSVVITVMNEEENIKPLLEAVRNSLSGIDYEVVLVDDGSTDKTKQQVLEYADDRTVLIELRKNYGQSTAMTAGIDHSRGRYIALLDGDLQNDPSDIPSTSYYSLILQMQLLQPGIFFLPGHTTLQSIQIYRGGSGKDHQSSRTLSGIHHH